jgi:hypothetical protein
MITSAGQWLSGPSERRISGRVLCRGPVVRHHGYKPLGRLEPRTISYAIGPEDPAPQIGHLKRW